MLPTQQLAHRLNEAIAHHQAGRLERAEVLYRQLASAAPREAFIFQLWGQATEQQGRLDEAMRLYAQASRLDPKSGPPVLRQAFLLAARRRAPDAEALLRRFLQQAPENHEAWNALAYVLKLQGRLMDAIACHQRAIEIAPQVATSYCELGATLGLAGRNHQALQYYDRALALDPKLDVARYGRAQSLHRTYRVEEAVADYDAFLRAQPQHFEARSFRLYALQHLAGISRERLFAEHRAYGEALPPPPPTVSGSDFARDRSLRVAILSPDLRTHACAYFLEPLLRHLDPTQFQLLLYHDHFHEDAVSARLRKLAVVWRNFVGQPSSVIEPIIRADRPDILIDLTGHVANTVRLPLIAKRLAPVQITYLGYPDTTGVPAMDFRFTDPIADPAGEADRFATEKLVRFSSTAWCYQPPADAPEPADARSADAPVTFGCFNSPIKFSDDLFIAWARILNRQPAARLLLKGRDLDEPAVRQQLLARMEASGLPVERVELMPRTATTAEHLAQYARIDVALDTFHYNGTTTTCEALWVGRPVVTLCGDRHASRVSTSLLRAIGRDEWVADSVDRYVEIACGLATDRASRTGFARTARDEMRRSALMDEVGQSRRFAVALRECWASRCPVPEPTCSAVA